MSAVSTVSVVAADHLSKWYGPVIGLNDVSLAVPPGITGLLGPNGAGKSTFMKLMTGQLKPSKGGITVLGEPIWENPSAYFRVGFCPEQDRFYERMTGREWVAALVGLNGVTESAAKEMTAGAIETVGLSDVADKKIAAYSKGMRQRIKLAQAICHDPRVLLLDEPLSALDEFLRLQMRGELRRIQADVGITFVHVTHTQLEAIALADMVVVMDQGQIEQAASAREVYDRPRTGYVARFMGGQNVLSGTVVSRDAAMVTIDSGPKQVTLSAPSAAVTVGSKFEAAVRRDHVRLARVDAQGAPAGPNAVTGRVAAIEYQGTWLKITLEEACGEEFVANLPDAVFFADPLAIGDAVIARWDPDELHFLSTAAKGALAGSAGSPLTEHSEMATAGGR